MHFHNCRCLQKHQRIIWQSLSALCLAPRGSGSSWNYLGASVRATEVSRRFACGFPTALHFPDVSVAIIGKNSTVKITSTSNNCAPTVRQGCECYTAINCSMLFLNAGLRGQSLQSVLEFNITNMHAMPD
jgi:hypothetical protein